ncbi:hypothetical protein DUNSADRAFT_11854 [Dunaliella salina]|uniref:Encoded protein n=1 Tax=Dunaliella salina TaxID=3046 RepID=A0ABQ7GCF1_DUNSA|nr:hypothetical protein DUNSADRAFT_11854 [Dunaliella salina]|eukprot:KAF5832289.1 hypothetical protein DUNSADRAFT_11854 [Dunaliella salina]
MGLDIKGIVIGISKIGCSDGTVFGLVIPNSAGDANRLVPYRRQTRTQTCSQGFREYRVGFKQRFMGNGVFQRVLQWIRFTCNGSPSEPSFIYGIKPLFEPIGDPEKVCTEGFTGISFDYTPSGPLSSLELLCDPIGVPTPTPSPPSSRKLLKEVKKLLKEEKEEEEEEKLLEEEKKLLEEENEEEIRSLLI